MLIETSKLRLNVVDEGPRDAPAVIFSHSLAANVDMWAAQSAALATRLRVVRYDTRGHGGSDVPDGPYGFPDLVGDVVALLDALGIARAHFVGLSLGGMTALGLALDHPDRVLSICVANCAARTAPAACAMWDQRIRTARDQGMQALVEPTLARWCTAAMIERRAPQLAMLRQMIAGTPVAGYIACCAALKTLDYFDRLSSLALPVMFIAGAHDPAVPVCSMREMHDLVWGSRYVELPSAHLSNIECEAAFTAALEEFL